MGGGKPYMTPGFVAAMVVLGSSGLVIIVVVAIFFTWSIWAYCRYLNETSDGVADIGNRLREDHANAMEHGRGGPRAIQSPEVGVPPGFIKTLPLLRYSKNGAHLAYLDVKGHMSECPVCLSEYKEGDRIRLLPNCKHIFHPECINTWLESHTTCPLCRTDVQGSKKVTKLSSLERILTFLRRSGGGAQIVDSSARDHYTGGGPPRETVVIPPPMSSSTRTLPVSTNIEHPHSSSSRPVSRELHIVHVTDAPATSSSEPRQGMIFSSVWGPYVDEHKVPYSESDCSSSSGVGFTQVSVTTVSSEDISGGNATDFVTISLDGDHPER